MSLKLYNTMTRSKEEFKPLEDKTVKMYACGPTVYFFQHIGNYRKFLFDDILRRVLEYNGYSVDHVMNITDVGHLVSDEDEGEDKMEKGARREGKSAWDIAEFYTKDFFENENKLHILKPTIISKATDHIQEQIDLIKTLEEKGYTYVIDDGVYFDTSKLDDYGKLAKLDIEGLKEGARVQSKKQKKNSTDFALWKFSPHDAQREMEWESPWGKGFPGWHIECSAMAKKYLGDTIDIHTGGIEHIPIHHTNEIAQSESANGKIFAKYWMHGEHLRRKDGVKMSKSEGTIITIKDIQEKGYSPLSFRYLSFLTHYRMALEFSWDGLEAAQNALENLYRKFSELPDGGNMGCEDFEKKFLDAVNDDLNMPQALAAVWDMLKSDCDDGKKKVSLKKFDQVLGFGLSEYEVESENIPEDVMKLMKQRDEARAKKDFETSDKLRDQLVDMGYEVEDGEEGTVVRKTI